MFISHLQEKSAEDWIANINPEYLPLVMAFKIQDDSIYPASMFTESIIATFSASKWWQLMQKKTEKTNRLPAEFCHLMMGLHSAPSSSASLERVFSTFGLIWSKLRNRLGPEKAAKLVKVYQYLRGNGTGDHCGDEDADELN